MKRAFYHNSIGAFVHDDPDTILGQLTRHSPFSVEQTQRDAWLGQIDILKQTLANLGGTIYFEYAIPRMGKRVDVILLIGLNVATQTLSPTPQTESAPPLPTTSPFRASARILGEVEPKRGRGPSPTPESTSSPIPPAASAMPLTPDPTSNHTYSVFLSGNGPLVKVLQEALACWTTGMPLRRVNGGSNSNAGGHRWSSARFYVVGEIDESLPTITPPPAEFFTTGGVQIPH